MRRMLEHILAQYGSEMTLHMAEGERRVRAFLQPVTAKGLEAARRTIQELGEIPEERYLYIGPAQTPLQEDDSVEFQAERYRVCRAQTLVVADEALYVWALARKEGGNDPWTS